MPGTQQFILGEFRRTLDDRFRLSLPTEMSNLLGGESADCILAKERPGSISLWNASAWQAKLEEGVELIKRKMQAGKLEGRLTQVQLLGRLLSTRHRAVALAGRGRLLIPEGFREFLGVEPGGEVLIVGAAVCLEIWNPPAWLKYLEQRMPRFQHLFDQLSQLSNVTMPGPVEVLPHYGTCHPFGMQVTRDRIVLASDCRSQESPDRAWFSEGSGMRDEG